MQAPAVPPAAPAFGSPAFGSGALHVSQSVAHAAFSELRAATVAARAAVPNTTQAYGDSVNFERGIPREWWAWCQAGPGVDVCGHVTPSNKEVYNALVTPEKVEMFVVTHFALRGKLSTKGKSIPGTTCSKDMVLKVKKALNDLYLQQLASNPLEMVGVLPPKNAKLASVLASLMRAKKAASIAGFDDPGLHHSHHQRLTEQQLNDVSAYGLLDNAKGPLRNSLVIGPEFHWTATAGLVAFLRSDSALSVLLTNLFVMNAPSRESGGRQLCKVLGICMGNGKTTTDWDTSYSIRHENPLLCLHFATAFLLFWREHTPGLGLTLKDFVPKPRGQGENPERAWYGHFLVAGNNKGTPGRQGAKNPETTLSYQTNYERHKMMMKQLCIEVSKVCHLWRNEAAVSSAEDGVARSQTAKAGHWHHSGEGSDALEDCYLRAEVPYEVVRQRAGWPREGGFFFLVRDTEYLQITKEQADATFGHLRILRAVGTDAFPLADACYATLDYIEVLRHMATVLWQDLAVLWPRMKCHPIFSQPPFSDNSVGWISFREKVALKVADSPSPELTEAAERARRRGDLQQAQVLTLVAKEARAAAAVPGRGALVEETHQMVSSLVSTSLGTLSPTALASLRATQAEEARVVEATAAVAAVALEAEKAIDPSDPETWPEVDPDGTLPFFALRFEFKPAATVEALVEEYIRGAPAVRDLEAKYGPGVRNGKKGKGSSYRSKALHGKSQRKDNAFAKRKLVYAAIDAEGEAGVERLQGMIAAQFGEQESPSVSHMEWLYKQLASERGGFEKRSKVAAEGAKKRKRVEAGREKE